MTDQIQEAAKPPETRQCEPCRGFGVVIVKGGANDTCSSCRGTGFYYVVDQPWPADTVFIVRYPSGAISSVYRNFADAQRDAGLVNDGRHVESWVAR